jgi:hypothetical protein
MTGPILALIIVSPIASCIALYQCFNHGRLPCVNAENIDNHNQILPEN